MKQLGWEQEMRRTKSSSVSFAGMRPLNLPAGGDGKRTTEGGLQYSVIDISFDPVVDPSFPMSKELNSDYLRLFDAVETDPKAAIPEIEVALDRHPHHPKLYNLLTAAYGKTSQRELAREVARKNFERNGHDLFARANWANVLIARGKFDEAGAIFDSKFLLAQVFPGRTKFHVSELIAISGVAVQYFIGKGELDIALSYFDMLDQVVPDHPTTALLEDFLERALLLASPRHLRSHSSRKKKKRSPK